MIEELGGLLMLDEISCLLQRSENTCGRSVFLDFYRVLSAFQTAINSPFYLVAIATGTCFIQKIYAPSSSLLQGKHLPFSPSPLRFNIFRLFVILSLTQLYRYTPKKFLFSTATIKYTYRAPLRRIGQEYSANVSWSTFQSSVRVRRPYLINFCIVSFVMEMYLLLG
jgi:hypothetical protein